MKEKILILLKKAREKNSNVTDRSLEEQAEMASKFILTEEQVVLYDAKAVIATIQGNINHTMKLNNDKIKAEQEAEKIKKEAIKKAEEEEVARKKKLEEDTETPDWAKALSEQNRILTEQLSDQNKAIESLKTEKITSKRIIQVDEVLKDLPKIVSHPIRKSFESTSFENEDKFIAYLEEMITTKDSFIQEAAEKGINIITPKLNVKKVELNGQTKELHGALAMVEIEKEKESKKIKK